ncbi:MAG: magnesium transporter, partial [candidate division WOR-3 bacterium]
NVATTWVHLDVRAFNQVKYLQDRFFCKDDTTMNGTEMIKLLRLMDPVRKIAVLNEMSPDDRADLFERLPAIEVKKIITLLRSDESQQAKELMAYKGNTAGGLMTVDFIKVYSGHRVNKVLNEIRKAARDLEFVHYVYVVDRFGRLKGSISLKDLIATDPRKRIKDVMNTSLVTVPLEMDQEEVAKLFSKYDRPSLPVVDRLGRIKGIITADDVLDVVQEEHTEDMQRFGASGRIEEYLHTHPFTVARKRFFWLMILALSGFISGFVMERFTFLIQSMSTLLFFIPTLMDSGGNAGTQAATVVIRGLAIGEIKISDIWYVVWKELLTGLLLGIALGVIISIRAHLIQRDPVLGLIVGLAMASVIIIATVLGGLLPFIFQKLGLDPALMSGPLITTILDSTTLLIYFGIALVLRNIIFTPP